MILRKPYAFLIKNFKLIHAFLTAGMLYLLFQTNNINKFFNQFKTMGDLRAELGISDTLFNDYMFLIPWLVIVLTLILLGIMIKKQKPKLFYLFNIVTNITVIFIYSYVHGEVLFMETNIISGQRINLASDLTFMILILQVAAIIPSIIRTLGLDLKRFDFGEDLMQLEIEEEDNEEVEINVEFESNVAKRKFNKSKRFLRYFYFENMLAVNLTLIILFGTITYLIYINSNVYSASYNQGETFNTGDSMVTILKTYITNQNSKGIKITKDETTLVVLNVGLSRGSQSFFNTAKAQLYIDGRYYYPKKDYHKKLADLGVGYIGDDLNFERTRYLIVYEIPTSIANKKMIFRYLNEIGISSSKIETKYIKVDLNPFNLEQSVTKKEINLNEKIVMNNNTMGETTFELKKVEIAKKFDVVYNFCLSSNDCYESVEYVKPLLNTNYEKALIKLEGNIEVDQTMNIRSIKNIYNVITYFGKVRYVKDGKSYVINKFTKVEPKKINKAGIYYIEVDADILDADEVYLILKNRSYEYQYTIKQKEELVEG